MRLTKNQKSDWSINGFLRIASFFNVEEIKNLLDWVEAIESCGTVDAIHHYEQTHDGIKPSRTENFIHDHEGFQKLFTTGKILEYKINLSSLTGVPNLCLKIFLGL